MSAFPPPGPTTLLKTLPSYLYCQYADDDALQAFIAAYNTLAQNYVDTFGDLSLPVYTGAGIAGALLDWVALGLYGLARPTLPAFGSGAKGAYNTSPYNVLVYNGRVPAVTQTTFATTDDIFKRILTWHFYKGDGQVFSLSWLKRRVLRFLTGPDGIGPVISNAYTVSVTFTGAYAATITIPTGPAATIFQAAVLSGALELPFQYSWSVVLV